MISLLFRHSKTKKLPGYSLIEIVISLALIGLSMVMLSNVMISALKVSQITIARSLMREEMTSIMDSISNDFRNAITVDICQGSVETDYTQVDCRLTGKTQVDWTVIKDSNNLYRIQRSETTSGTTTLTYESPQNMEIKQLSFDQGFSTAQSNIKKNILVTLVANHHNSLLNIKNLIQQITVSTRNYDL